MLDLILTSQNLYCRKEFVITSFDGYRVFNCNTYILTSHDIHVVSVSFTSGHAYNSSSSLIPSFSCTKKKKLIIIFIHTRFIIDEYCFHIYTPGTIYRHAYQQTTSNPIRTITSVKTTDPSNVLANLIIFGYRTYKFVYSKCKKKNIEPLKSVRKIR